MFLEYEELINKLDINKNEFETSLPIAIAVTAASPLECI